ncbi:ferredoxin [Bacteroidia bacterium]|nr:ferredoxin [Bacteroidia bacterium]
MIRNERVARKEQVLRIGLQMMTAARTAPKGKGMDIIEIALVTDDDITRLSDELQKLGEEKGLKFMLRDATNILHAEAILLVGTASRTHGLNCAHCGYPTCGEKPDFVPCALNSVDVGIALGSACATAADLRVDTRVMFSAGLAAQQLHLLGDCKTVFAIPISASSKNPFFDRKVD